MDAVLFGTAHQKFVCLVHGQSIDTLIEILPGGAHVSSRQIDDANESVLEADCGPALVRRANREAADRRIGPRPGRFPFAVTGAQQMRLAVAAPRQQPAATDRQRIELVAAADLHGFVAPTGSDFAVRPVPRLHRLLAQDSPQFFAAALKCQQTRRFARQWRFRFVLGIEQPNVVRPTAGGQDRLVRMKGDRQGLPGLVVHICQTMRAHKLGRFGFPQRKNVHRNAQRPRFAGAYEQLASRRKDLALQFPGLLRPEHLYFSPGQLMEDDPAVGRTGDDSIVRMKRECQRTVFAKHQVGQQAPASDLPDF